MNGEDESSAPKINCKWSYNCNYWPTRTSRVWIEIKNNNKKELNLSGPKSWPSYTGRFDCNANQQKNVRNNDSVKEEIDEFLEQAFSMQKLGIFWHSSYHCQLVLLVNTTSCKIFLIHLLYFRYFYWRGACKNIYGHLQHVKWNSICYCPK